MARWRAFVDVLDDLLSDRRESVADVVARTGTRRAVRTTSTQPLYTLNSPLRNRFWSTPGPYQTGAPATATAPRQRPQPEAPPAPRPEAPRSQAPRAPRIPRRLKPAEQTALQTLVNLGASLDGAFTARELRTAFRALAQRYHPDRHPGANDAERMRLGATFAELTSAYGVLSDSVQ